MPATSPSRFQQFWKEVKRRNVAQVATVYAMTAWLVIQFAVAVFPYLGFPNWSVTAVIVLALVGFPIALIISWIYELGPDGLVATPDVDEEPITAASTKRKSSMGSVVIVVLAALLVGQYFYFKHWKADTVPVMAQVENARSNAIAVLPFVNRSSDADQEFFSDGLTEDIITQLAKLEDLHVISRSTCMKFKGDTLSMKEIGRQLNVGTILEGSVQRAGDQLRITAQLIDVAADGHIWAESYDRSVNDLFAIQREIAMAIAEMLHRKLTPAEQNQLAEVPTQNIEAYQAYLKGRHLSHSDSFLGEAALKAIEHLNDAVQLDSTFALAYAELARCHARAYYLKSDRSEERLDMAREDADRALRLDPDMPEVHLAIGDYYNWAFRDKKKAMEHWSIAEQGLPNNTEVIYSRAYVLFMEGKIDECIAQYTRVTELSPKNANAFDQLAWAKMWAHDFPGSIAAADRAIELAPETNWSYLYRGLSHFLWKGPGPEAYAAFDAVDHEYSWYFWSMWLSELSEGKIEAAQARVNALPEGWDNRKTDTYPMELHQAWIHALLGEDNLAKEKYKQAVTRLEEPLAEHPDDPRYNSAMGMALAGAGQGERGIELAKKATDILSYEKDACYGINPMYDLAATYTLSGKWDKAFEQVEFCLANPGYFTVEYLKADPRYHALKSDPRFQALLKKYALHKVS